MMYWILVLQLCICMRVYVCMHVCMCNCACVCVNACVCVQDGAVSGLSLEGLQLSGGLPDNLARLAGLKALNMARNILSGTRIMRKAMRVAHVKSHCTTVCMRTRHPATTLHTTPPYTTDVHQACHKVHARNTFIVCRAPT